MTSSTEYTGNSFQTEKILIIIYSTTLFFHGYCSISH